MIVPYERVLYPTVDPDDLPSWTSIKATWRSPEVQRVVLEQCIEAEPERADYRRRIAEVRLRLGLSSSEEVAQVRGHIDAGLSAPDFRRSHGPLGGLATQLDEAAAEIESSEEGGKRRHPEDAVSEALAAKKPREAMATLTALAEWRTARGLPTTPGMRVQEQLIGLLLQLNEGAAQRAVESWAEEGQEVSPQIQSHPAFADTFD